MIVGILNPGSGIGDMLFSYIATRVRAADLGVPFGFVGKEYWKGKGWMDLDFGEDTSNFGYHIEQPSDKLFIDHIEGSWSKEFVLNTPYYDPEFNFIPDWSVIDGYGAQDIRYFEHRLDEVREWLKVEPLFVHPEKCIINFRGGEYKSVPELYLPKEYWLSATATMLIENPLMDFEIHTDDPITAHEILPFYTVQNIELNWRSIRYAKHLIISNSAFAILPALLNENVKEVIAPKFWAGRNVGEWRRPGNYYKKFTYI